MQAITHKTVANQYFFSDDSMVKEKGELETDKVSRVTIQVSPEARDLFRAACESKAVDRSIGNAATNLIMWFVRQIPIVQTAITNDVDAGMERVYANALRRLADQLDEAADRTIIPEDFAGSGSIGRIAAKPRGHKPHQ